jgi:uncharacterized protein
MTAGESGAGAPPFWRTKQLSEMTGEEWESLCDGCAKCCLVKLEDEDSGRTLFTNLACRLLDHATCQCSDYENRKEKVPICVKLTPEIVASVDWLPRSCAYRLVHEGKDLPDWHHLVCGDREEVHRRGVSGMGRLVNEDDIPPDTEEDYIVDWADRQADAYRRRLLTFRRRGE